MATRRDKLVKNFVGRLTPEERRRARIAGPPTQRNPLGGGSFRAGTTPQYQRPELTNPNQHTPNPRGPDTFSVPGPKLKWPWQKTDRGTYS